MDKEEIMEQPEAEQAEEKTGKEISADSESGSIKNKTDEENFGQFKSAQALLEAYNNLRAEFTRKCQKLSEFEKEKTGENKLSDSEIEDGLSKFLSKNIDAKDYTEEIKEKVKSEKTDPFESVWTKMLVERLSGKEKINDPFIKKHVFYDEEFRNKVIESYMQDLNSKKPPILLKTERGERATKLEPVAPKSLKDAKKLVEDMFS